MNRIKRGDIYCADLHPVVGSEQGGVRPVLILQNDVNNKYSPTTIVAAITSRKKKSLSAHVTLNGFGLNAESIVLLEQIRTIDKTCLRGYIGTVDKPAMEQVDRAIVDIFGIKYLEGILHG